ncbi:MULTISPECIES: efflux RND transporter periplasmic adaptor subunit [Paraburkholderia]|uniref:efflux RND transporter periplasmic adaptor subunit n=1 Tax=Paraburkholderia TaxID=1822464 RepID=UPI0022598B06|nr:MULTISPECIES: efflux RND transporter periplasmic adaptor subunit [Paraburkholderia]MCX4164225.1 efflux RND transporter periplasmic adaptor subunit [Paraburkholderia megapolitana]MDN7159719.1 efflux RND transporter periplasmic adaptor subunit [Paraburkholderia sp. CHISQ3]MDQ6496766.1 efflux RND transporter periplasmic adaptor subunit [Paraburkholderia megapolitana]
MSTQHPESAPAAVDRKRRALRLAAIAAGLALALAVGIVPRLDARAALRRQTAALAVQAVQITQPVVAPPDQTLVLPADIEANQQTAIFARTNGYLKAWYADIGTHVKAGQLLARIDAPEVDAALRQARADAQQAQANDQLAEVTATRWQQLVQTHAVSQQETDMKESDAQAKHAALAAAQSNVARLAQMQSYEKVYAPFDGVITARNVDVGALIDAGSAGGPSKEMFDLAQTSLLRVYADVPQNEVGTSLDGTPACLEIAQFPGRCVPGTVARNSGAINPVTRTLRIEVDVPNADGAVLPGSFGQIRVSVRSARPGLSLPVNTLLYRPQGLQVATVDAQQKVLLKTIKPGRDFGMRIEVTDGLAATDRVILNPSDSITDGQAVRVLSSAGTGTSNATANGAGGRS